MKTKNKNLFEIMFAKILAVVVCVAAFGGAQSWADDGCADDNNVYISPMLSLCTVHAYNIGSTENPDDETKRETMEDVVALKTTIIAQQMKKQYDYLDATIKRLEMQLKRATLKTELTAAGASTDDDGGSNRRGYRSSEPNVYLSNTHNCINEMTPEKAIECFQQNYQRIYSETNGGTSNISANARKQLAGDYKHILVRLQNKTEASFSEEDKKCTDAEKLKGNKADFQTCLNSMNWALQKVIKDNSESQSKAALFDKVFKTN